MPTTPSPVSLLDPVRVALLQAEASTSRLSNAEYAACVGSLDAAAGTDPLAAALLARLPKMPAPPDFMAEAEAFADFAVRMGTQRGIAYQKALDGARFSRDYNARSFAVPSKLCGVKAHREKIEAFAAQGLGYGVALTLTLDGDRIAASVNGHPLGFIQDKHAPWVRPLLGYGVRCHVLQVTGLDNPAHTPGINVAFSGITEAVRAFEAEAAEPGTTPERTAAEMARQMAEWF